MNTVFLHDPVEISIQLHRNSVKRHFLFFNLLLLLALLLSGACSRRPAGGSALQVDAASATPLAQPVAGASESEQATATPSPVPPASATAAQTPTQTATVTVTPTASATPTATPSPTITPTPLHPLAIEAMRRQAYPGSEIVIEETLEPGANYDRYIVSYLSEGHKIYALLTVPRGERPATGWPVIIFNHGYIPPQIYQTTEEYQPHIDTYARHEYIVLRPDYRGHGNSEGEARGAYGWPDYTVDVLNALASIKRFAEADANRVGMWGHSMGGQITLRAMVVADDIRAGVIWAGVVGSYPDLLARWRRSGGFTPTPDPVLGPRGWRQRLIAEYGTPQENPDFWASISPNSYLTELSGPLQLHHGDADEIVPVELSQLLEVEMQAAGQYVDLWVYEGDDHNLNNWFNFAMRISLIFFDRYVKNYAP